MDMENVPMQGKAEIVERSAEIVERPQNMAQAFDRFLASLDIKESSKATYKRALKHFFLYMRDRGIVYPVRDDIIAYKRYLIESGKSSYTVSNYLTAVRRFFEFMHTHYGYDDVTRGVKGAKQRRGYKKEPLTIEQIKMLLGSIDRSTLIGKRDYALLNLLIRTGLRTIEVARADVGDIRQEGGETILWVQGKGRDDKDEFVVLTEATMRPIREYLRERGKVQPDEPLFAGAGNKNRGRLTTRTISRIVKERLRAVGIDDDRITAHSLRHTAVTLTLRAGASIQEAQAMARHANINTTMIYAHNINRVKNAAEKRIDELLGD
jgi:integrase/recombinase XerD